ncbi:MAG: short-chain dehydrogenase/reductase [Halothiobacillaceae bacterium]|nr:MAG: short-chain dehydrogenase/reductase [Halothiobacillaceae bacterium]
MTNTVNRKTILITGCSSGIGRCAALTLQARGYRVFATARRPDDVTELAALGLESLLLDLDNSDSINQAVTEILARTGGKLDALFNNAAYGQAGAVEDLTREAMRAQFETNLFGTLELTNCILPVMRQQGHGRIVFNSSVLGLIALPYRGAYNATKFALEGLCDTLRLELADTPLKIVLIEPGPIESRFRANAHLAYQRYINREQSPHRDKYLAMERRLTQQNSTAAFTLPPDAVVEKLIHALEHPRPQPRYYVTVPTHLFGFLRRFFSTRMMDTVALRVSRGEHK